MKERERERERENENDNKTEFPNTFNSIMCYTLLYTRIQIYIFIIIIIY